MQEDEVIIYEAAFKYNNLFIRADVIEKKGNVIRLHEVKAKSFIPGDSFLNTSGYIASNWKPYLYDVAFQKYVIKNALPGSIVKAHLMMANKRVNCKVDGLNQKFKIVKNEDRRKEAKLMSELTDADLSPSMLCIENVDSMCEMIFEGTDSKEKSDKSFEENINYLAKHYSEDTKITSRISKDCKNCQYKTTTEDVENGKKSGFNECWQKQTGMSDAELLEPSILDIWNFRKKDELIKQGKYKMADLSEGDIEIKESEEFGISTTQRQWLQIEKIQNNDTSDWVDKVNLKAEMASWKFPLHFIDFETSAVAIPFFKDQRPYEGVAFQFSHHVVYENGRVEHNGEFLNTEPGYFPNFDFIRELKKELEKDEGTIFRYATHENTYLNLIYAQILQHKVDVPDHEEIIDFIKSITHSKDDSPETWNGDRDMVDLLKVVTRYYYHPMMKGSNSIKYVLPAILNSSEYLQKKYIEPIYGAENGIESKNFSDWKWVEFDENGVVKDPYKLLPKLFIDASENDLDALMSDSDSLANGGAALTAYGKLQFEDISDYERKELRKALLKYCELDTMAMVMIYEAWREMVK